MTIGANLLKLVEFPFAYSLIAILALIGGSPINFDELSFATFAPLLLLLGFMATALVIVDPFGRMIKKIVRHYAYKLPSWVSTTVPSAILASRIRTLPQSMRKIAEDMKVLEEAPQSLENTARLDLLRIAYDHEKQLHDDLIKERTYGSLGESKDLINRVEETRWVSINIEKNIAMFYFASILLLFLVFLPTQNMSGIFVQYFTTSFSRMDANLVIPLIWGLCAAAFAAVAYSIFRAMQTVVERSRIVFIFLLATASKLNIELVKPIEESMNSEDWGKADFYKRLLEFEIKQKGDILQAFASQSSLNALGRAEMANESSK